MLDYVALERETALYRIIDTSDAIGTSTDVLTFTCEHVFAVLLDQAIPRELIFNNVSTSAVITGLLNKQNIKNWTLGTCEFNRFFSYLWEKENLASAIFDVPKRFDTPYYWDFDTSVYPWRLNLLVLNTAQNPQFFVNSKKNLIAVNRENQGREIVTRLYAYGYGEGINQLTIASVNGGKEYIDAPQDVMSKYGLIEKVWVDRRFQDSNSLLARARVLLESYSQPRLTYSIDIADLGLKLTHETSDIPKVGNIIRFQDFKSYILEFYRYVDKDGQDKIVVANTLADVASSIADMAERQLINQNYAQGNTFLYPMQCADNADAQHPVTLRVYIPAEARFINKAILIYTLENFRAYETGAASGGGGTTTSGASSRQTSASGGSYTSTNTSSSGGNSTQTSSSGGGSTQTSSSGGGTSSTQTSNAAGQATITQTSAAARQATVTSNSGGSSVITATISGVLTPNGVFNLGTGYEDDYGYTTQLASASGLVSHAHTFYIPKHSHYINHSHSISIPSHTHTVTTPSHDHSVTVNVPAHTHDVSINIPAHTHSVNTPAHTHSVSIPAHTHTVNINIPSHTHDMNHTHSTTQPAHTHPITYGIYEGGKATSVTLKVDGKTVAFTGSQIDVAKNFAVDGGGNITRGTYHEIQIIPDKLTRITANLTVQMFIQSEGGGNY
jgi:phage minor structural protein